MTAFQNQTESYTRSPVKSCYLLVLNDLLLFTFLSIYISSVIINIQDSQVYHQAGLSTLALLTCGLDHSFLGGHLPGAWAYMHTPSGEDRKSLWVLSNVFEKGSWAESNTGPNWGPQTKAEVDWHLSDTLPNFPRIFFRVLSNLLVKHCMGN